MMFSLDSRSEKFGKKNIIKHLRIDNGWEFCEGQFYELCKNEEIVRHHTVRKMPQLNGVVERMNKTLLEKVRTCFQILV